MLAISVCQSVCTPDRLVRRPIQRQEEVGTSCLIATYDKDSIKNVVDRGPGRLF